MKSIFILLFVALSLGVSAQTTLTQAQVDSLKTDTKFQTYLGDQIFTKVVYYVGLSSYSDLQTAKNTIYSRYLRTNANVVYGDATLSQFMLVQMAVRGLDKGDNAVQSSAANKVISYLNGGGIGFLVDDYFVEKTKNY